MFFRYQILIKAGAFVLLMCLANVCATAQAAANAGASGDFSDSSMTGVLSTDGEQAVSVNGNSAEDGVTIVSGAEIKTGDDAALISLNGLGEVRINPNTTGKLIFGADGIKLSLSAGNAQLTALQGVKGLLINADGNPINANSAFGAAVIGDAADSAPADAVEPSFVDSLLSSDYWDSMPIIGNFVKNTRLGAEAASAAAMKSKCKKMGVSKIKPCRKM